MDPDLLTDLLCKRYDRPAVKRRSRRLTRAEKWQLVVDYNRTYGSCRVAPQSSMTDLESLAISMRYEERVIGCFKGLATGDAIGKQTETLTRTDVQRWYPRGITGFHGLPGDVIPRYAL